MPTYLQGAGGAPGIALGRAFRLREAPAMPAPRSEAPDEAIGRFTAALSSAVERLNAIADQQRELGFEQEAGIFEFQAMLVEDPSLIDEVTRLVRQEGQSLDAALGAAIGMIRDSVAAIDDPYLRERAADVDAIGKEIRKALYGGVSLASVPPGAIVIAPDLTPAETAELRSGTVGGFATAFGGPTGHTAILARALGIPAVVGLGAAALDIADDAEIILDGGAALLIAEPSPDERATYLARAGATSAASEQRRLAFHDRPGSLADDHRVAVWANIGHPAEAEAAMHQGAEGIGLFRTEVLFLDRISAPSEDEQFATYRTVLETMAGRPVVIRTLDIGGDKFPKYLDLPHEDNPFLGVRGLRLCMRHPDLFAVQLRALLRAAAHGDLWVMLPMVATLDDLRWGRAQLQAAAAALAAEGVPHRADVRLGVMIETPAAAVTADLLAREAAFFSVGSNDLTQYTMAADRGLADLAQRYPHDSPAVLRLIAQAARAAAGAGIPLGVCGELAGVPAAAPLLAGLGVAELSMAPAMIPAIKEQLAQITLEQAQAQARAAMKVDDGR